MTADVLLHIWPVINSIALIFVGAVGWLIRHTLQQFQRFEEAVESLNHTLEHLNITIVKLETAFEQHTRLDDIRFKEISEEMHFIRERYKRDE